MENLGCYGEGNFLLVCLEMILRDQVLHLPDEISNGNWCLGDFKSRYSDVTLDESKQDGRAAWSRLREELDAHREALMYLSDFMADNFKLEGEQALQISKKLHRSFERYVKEIEIDGARLRDMLEMRDSANAIEKLMKTSKRVRYVS